MNISERIKVLRNLMKERGIDIYIVPTADYHQSEYVGEYFKAREFMTGFTGSAGIAVFAKDESFLWTDGRYFIQAEEQLEGSGIQLQKIGMPDTMSLKEYLEKALPHGGCLGFDGRTVGVFDGKAFEKIAKEKEGHVSYEEDLVGEIWKDRPELPQEPAFSLDEKYAGESVASKLNRLRQKLKEKGANVYVLTSLDDIGWLLNIRGNDVAYCPLMLSYAVVREGRVELYTTGVSSCHTITAEKKFGPEVLRIFTEHHITLHPYDAVYRDIRELSAQDTVMLDPERLNYLLYRNIPEKIRKIECENPTILMKAVKNAAEVNNIRKAHLKDGIAFTKFMYWLKTNIGKIQITERSASDKLEAFRSEQEHFLGPSFAPISAYGEHGAIVHYSATEKSDVELKPEGLYLADTGGHYLEGSTDITRTVALGKLTSEEKQDFTMVAASMLNLADAVFLKGCTGMNLDYAARAVFWKQHKDFNHGTGHGVGYLSNVHEPPVSFHWRYRPGNYHPLEVNMVITDEPGIYVEGKYGIRTENELLVSPDEENAYGQFLRFESLTLAPIDLDALDPEQMTEEECRLLNAYHKKVYEQLSPYLTEPEQTWLQKYTAPIYKPAKA